MFQGFKQFILKGNVVDLAVGVVMGVAFNGVISALVKDLFTPLISTIIGKPNFNSFSFTFLHGTFLIGDFINALLTFLINAIVIYFAVVLPINKLASLTSKNPTAPTTKICPECISTIPVNARRCAYCTTILEKHK